MFSSSKANFCKNEDCPSSQELLEFQNGDILLEYGSDIRLHLASCEFCSAEIEFYSHYPQNWEEDPSDAPAPTEIPGPLYELAEALLKNRQRDPRSLNAFLSENNSVKDER